jgi:hypothetical protein
MARQRRKTSALLFATVYVGFLCLCQVACMPNKITQEPEIDPDKFALSREDKSTNKNNFVVVKITPGSPGMNVKEFWVTASITADQGTVKGATNKKGGKGLDYTEDLNSCSVAALAYSILKAKEDSQGAPITFRLQVIPGVTIKKADQYTLTVKVARRGHTETKSITLTAKQDGVGTKEKTEEESTSGTSFETSATTLGIVSGDATQHINGPTPPDALSIPTEEESPQLVSDTILPATQTGDVPNTHSEQRTDPCDSTINALDNNTDTSSQTVTSEGFAVMLKKDGTRDDSVRNFVLVTIKPNNSGMKLKEFAVTAHLENDLGVASGSSGKNANGFVYGKELNNCNLEKLFLTNNQSNCREENDAHFAQGGEVAFKIAIKPSATIRPRDQYTLTVKVAYTGSNPHTETQRTTLTAPLKSPVKGPKRSSPHKRK